MGIAISLVCMQIEIKTALQRVIVNRLHCRLVSPLLTEVTGVWMQWSLRSEVEPEEVFTKGYFCIKFYQWEPLQIEIIEIKHNLPRKLYWMTLRALLWEMASSIGMTLIVNPLTIKAKNIVRNSLIKALPKELCREFITNFTTFCVGQSRQSCQFGLRSIFCPNKNAWTDASGCLCIHCHIHFELFFERSFEDHWSFPWLYLKFIEFGNLINYWSMNWDSFMNPVCFLCWYVETFWLQVRVIWPSVNGIWGKVIWLRISLHDTTRQAW